MTLYKILVVEDELKLRETITEVLIFYNYDVKTASNGQEALKILDVWLPDIIISDIMMPIMDGHSFFEIIKDTKLFNQIPFIFLTAKGDDEEMEKCILNGADLFLKKPFKIDTLIKIIKLKIEKYDSIKNFANPRKNKHYFHEINTPLNGILGSVHLLIDDKNNLDENEIKFFQQAIKSSGDRLNRTLKNINLCQDLKNNKLKFSTNKFCEISNCFTVVKDRIGSLDKMQADRISHFIDESNIKIQENYLHIILYELVDNALKFSTIDYNIIVTGKKFNDQYYELSIEDFGIGFNDEEIKNIDAYIQFNRQQKEQQGLGLGLYISKTFIKRSKGVFSIISKKDAGTTLKIFLPLK